MSGWTLVPDDSDVGQDDVSNDLIMDAGSDASFDSADDFSSSYNELTPDLASSEMAPAVPPRLKYVVSVEPESSGNDTLVKIEFTGKNPHKQMPPPVRDTGWKKDYVTMKNPEGIDRFVKTEDLVRRKQWMSGIGSCDKDSEKCISPEKDGKTVKITSPGYTQSGVSREYEEQMDTACLAGKEGTNLKNGIKSPKMDEQVVPRCPEELTPEVHNGVNSSVRTISEVSSANQSSPGSAGSVNGEVKNNNSSFEDIKPVQSPPSVHVKPLTLVDRTIRPINTGPKVKAGNSPPNTVKCENVVCSEPASGQCAGNLPQTVTKTETVETGANLKLSPKPPAEKISEVAPAPQNKQKVVRNKKRKKQYVRAGSGPPCSSSDESEWEHPRSHKQQRLQPQKRGSENVENLLSKHEHKDLAEELAEQVNVSFTDKAISDDEKEKILSAVTLLVRNKMMKMKTENEQKKKQGSDEKLTFEQKNTHSVQASDFNKVRTAPEAPRENGHNGLSLKSEKSADTVTATKPRTKFSELSKLVRSRSNIKEENCNGQAPTINPRAQKSAPTKNVNGSEPQTPKTKKNLNVLRTRMAPDNNTVKEELRENSQMEESPVGEEQSDESDPDSKSDSKRRPYCKRRPNGTQPQCLECGVTFKHRSGLSRHRRIVHLKMIYKCPHCNFQFTRSDSLKLHLSRLESEKPEKKEGKTGPKGYTLYKRTKGGGVQPKCGAVEGLEGERPCTGNVKNGKNATGEVENDKKIIGKKTARHKNAANAPRTKGAMLLKMEGKRQKKSGVRVNKKQTEKFGNKKNVGKKSLPNVKSVWKAERRTADDNVSETAPKPLATKTINKTIPNKGKTPPAVKNTKAIAKKQSSLPTVSPSTKNCQNDDRKSSKSQTVKTPTVSPSGVKVGSPTKSAKTPEKTEKIQSDVTKGNATTSPTGKRPSKPPEVIHIKTTDGRVITVCMVMTKKDQPKT